MIKWPITYIDYNDEERTEDFYFNLNRAEVMEMELNANGAFAEELRTMVDQKDGKRMAEVFRNLILKSYGEKSPDGRRFVKSKEISDGFAQTEAYPALYMQLLTDKDAQTRFIEGILPKPEASGAPIPDSMRLHN